MASLLYSIVVLYKVRCMKRILIIDDEKTISSAISFGLKKIGHEIVVINNPVEVIAQLENQKFDLLILDYKITLLSGADVIKLIQNNKINIRTVILSSHNASEISDPGILAFSKNNYISKDQPISIIISQIENFIHYQNNNSLSGGSYAES